MMTSTSGDLRSSFVCQRCVQPLKIDSSIQSGDLTEHTLAELALPTFSSLGLANKHQIPSESADALPTSTVIVKPFKLEDKSTTDFALQDDRGEPAQLGYRLRLTYDLFNLVSKNSEVDHPLCEECTDGLLEITDQQLQLAEEEAQVYHDYLKKLDSEVHDSSSTSSLQEEVLELQEQEAALMSELKLLEKTEKDQNDKLDKLLKEKKEMDSEEEVYWKCYYDYQRKLLSAEDDYRSLECQFNYTLSQLDLLRKTNVYNATFHIWHTGHFGTINGFRLGRLPSIPVEWPEINAAWGQTALLLSCLSKKIGMHSFNRYQLVPYGSSSYIKVLADDKELPLYGSGGFRMIWDTKFDSAMVAFLDCLSQFVSQIESSGFKLPYEVDKEKGKIKDTHSQQFYSIKLQFNSEDSWTKTLKYLLTNLKWALAFVSTTYVRDSSKMEPENLMNVEK